MHKDDDSRYGSKENDYFMNRFRVVFGKSDKASDSLT